MHIAYLLTGGNLGNREETLSRAKDIIALKCGQVQAESALYETEAWGVKDQNLFLNQALKVNTTQTAHELLKTILIIEQQMGRVRDIRYGPRIIDIDILFFDLQVIKEPGLTVPHPELHNRRFALQCLAELTPHLVHPLFDKTVERLLRECTDPLKVYKLDK